MTTSGQLFSADDSVRPLADRLRPVTLAEFSGQSHLLSADSTLRQALEHNRLHSMVFWGPPGTGKTTLARMIASHCDAHFMSLSAVLSGVKDIRDKVKEARDRLDTQGQRSVLFVDEVHRFNKSQQDAFLPHIEDGTLYFVGATTENPSFELNNALLSRVRVYVLKHLENTDIRAVIDRALSDVERGLGAIDIQMDDQYRDLLAATADGDARHALVLLELAADCARREGEARIIDEAVIREVTRDSFRQFDKGGDHFYDQISALHKSMRGSDPDAALYWFCRMIDGGCDPRYIARRVLRFASEDIGNADPRAFQHAQYAWDAYTKLGSPEGELAIAHAIVFMSCAPKSNAVYKAFKSAMAFVRENGNQPVPMSLRNAPTKLMGELGHGDGYRYAHDEVDGFAAGAHYFPDTIEAVRFYEPVERGLEIRIGERLNDLRSRNAQAKKR
ncbi:replication-associated recombination protein A [Granulosicoccus antarcticus]|uniref:Replication-associated recombination protein A n=1 Tax=Granulosicoccus antarcticus IMCC3135 TaxID=1192854 RepID=A0A2Z2NV60_9GAMM|nr:replication-associated recombination protein A [Granulosicoccus antarcticus]ASJ75133.1 Replication-associated recombination protein A [Granulosicoccus antarcticus IMCC3135]